MFETSCRGLRQKRGGKDTNLWKVQVSTMDARELRMTPRHDDIPHQNLMISSRERSSWSRMITDWQCQWMGKNSASTGNQRSENLTGWPGNCDVTSQGFWTMTANLHKMRSVGLSIKNHSSSSPTVFPRAITVWLSALSLAEKVMKEHIFRLDLIWRAQWRGNWSASRKKSLPDASKGGKNEWRSALSRRESTSKGTTCKFA